MIFRYWDYIGVILSACKILGSSLLQACLRAGNQAISEQQTENIRSIGFVLRGIKHITGEGMEGITSFWKCHYHYSQSSTDQLRPMKPYES